MDENTKNENTNQKTSCCPCLNPYIAGILLGLTLLAAFLTLGAGLGASGGDQPDCVLLPTLRCAGAHAGQ